MRKIGEDDRGASRIIEKEAECIHRVAECSPITFLLFLLVSEQ